MGLAGNSTGSHRLMMSAANCCLEYHLARSRAIGSQPGGTPNDELLARATWSVWSLERYWALREGMVPTFPSPLEAQMAPLVSILMILHVLVADACHMTTRCPASNARSPSMASATG